MKAMLLEYLFDALLRAGLGIEHGCLYHIHHQVASVISNRQAELQESERFAAAYQVNLEHSR